MVKLGMLRKWSSTEKCWPIGYPISVVSPEIIFIKVKYGLRRLYLRILEYMCIHIHTYSYLSTIKEKETISLRKGKGRGYRGVRQKKKEGKK